MSCCDMDRPIPFRADRNAAREAAISALVRSAIAIARGVRERSPPADIAQKTWGREASRDVALVMRSASAPAMTTQTGWAAEVAHVSQLFLATLVPASAAADLLGRGLQLTFAGAATISLPTLNLAPPAAFLGQGKPVAVTQYVSSVGASLVPHKFGVSVAMTHEMMTSSNAEMLLRNQLVVAASRGLDAALFSANSETVDQPAGLLAGVVAKTPSASTIVTDAMVEDLSALGGGVGRAADTSSLVYVCAPEQALAVATNLPSFKYPLLSSAALPAKTVIALATDTLVSALEPVPEIVANSEAEVQFADPASEIVTAGGTVAYPVGSMVQSDRVALRMIMPVAWVVRAPGAIAFMNAVVW
jgi:hypothetical protein